MKLSYRLSPNLSPLSWVAMISPGTSAVSLVHGRFVETQPGFFVEGAWAGEFADGRMQDSDTVFGSGGTLAGGGLSFVSSIATTDFIYYSKRPHTTAVSNSLPLLLAALEDGLTPECTEYSLINMSILQGIRNYRPEIPTHSGQVQRLMHGNLRVDQNGIERIEKPLPPHFHDFASYRDHLQDRIGKLFANARHSARKWPLQIYSTQSKGYDSTAVNALATPFGIDMTFTSPGSKERGAFYRGQQAELPSDDGTPVCEVLGLPCTTIDRLRFRRDLTNEHFYWAGLDNNQDLNLHQIQSFVDRPTLLLTGNLGEIWYTREAIGKARLQTVNDELIRWDQAGHGLGEVRLKAGMIQVAVPFIGARRREEILQITGSAEMDAYRLGGAYDRPIPRRIAEEAGVPRKTFGQVKLASIVHLATPNLPVTEELRQAFFEHLRAYRLLGPLGISFLPVVQHINSQIYWKNPIRYFNNRSKHPLLWYSGYAWTRVSGQPLRFPMLWREVDSFLYAFCVNRVRDEYAVHPIAIKPAANASGMKAMPTRSAAHQEIART
jgi:hypothetical protein